MTRWNQTRDSIKNPVTVASDTETPTTPVHHTDRSTKPAYTHQTVPKTAQGNPAAFLSFDSGQPVRPHEKKIAANSTRMPRPKDLLVEVRINGKPTHCLLDRQSIDSVENDDKGVELYHQLKAPWGVASTMGSLTLLDLCTRTFLLQRFYFRSCGCEAMIGMTKYKMK